MGRGSSSAGGGVGKYGGGMVGGRGDTGVTVKSSQPLTKSIGAGGGNYANEIMNTRDAMEREYGSAVKELNLHTAKFNSPSILGAYGQNTLYMNDRYIKNPNLTEAMKEAEKTGFHPKIGKRTGAEAVTAHEIGHKLGETAAQRAGISERQIVERAAKKLGIKTENMGGHISSYARYNYSETIAEASSDVYCNGNRANKVSRAIMQEVKDILKKQGAK